MKAKRYYTVSFETFNGLILYPYTFRFLWTAKRFVKKIEDDCNFMEIKVSIITTIIGEYEIVR